MALGNAPHTTHYLQRRTAMSGGPRHNGAYSFKLITVMLSEWLFIYLFTFVCGTPRAKGRKDKTNWKDWRSGSPLSTKIWCNRIALKRYSVTDNRRYYKFLFISMTNNSYKRMSVKFPRKCSCRDGDNGQFLERSG